MSFLQELAKRTTTYGSPERPDPLDKYFQDHYTEGGGLFSLMKPTWSGVRIDENTAMTVSAVWAAIRLLAETMGSLPIITYHREKNDGRTRATEHPVYRLLHYKPNPEMNACTFQETMQMHQEMRGNSYAEIERNAVGDPAALWPLRPDKMKPVVSKETGRLEYRYILPSGKKIKFRPDQIFHVPAFCFNGIEGLSPIRAAIEEIGMSVAMTRYGGAFFRGGATPQGFIKHPKRLQPKGYSNLQESWYEAHGGLSMAQRVAILEEGSEFVKIGIPPEEAQFLGSRHFEIRDIARFWRVPPHMIGDMEHARYRNMEQNAIEFVTYSVRIRTVRWEAEILNKLIGPADRKQYYSEYLIDALLRGDVQARNKAYEIQRRNGIITGNDWARMENMNPFGPAGDKRFVPMNWVELTDAAPAGDGAGDDGKQRSRTRAEEREHRASSPEARNRLRAVFSKLIYQTADRSVRREVVDLRKLVKKHLGKRTVDEFEDGINEFYRGHADYMAKNFTPIFLSYAEAVMAAIADEIGGEAEITPELEEFAGQYTQKFAADHVRAGRNQMNKIIRDAEADEELQELLEERLEQWEQREARKITEEHTVRASDAFARYAFAAGGVTKLVWVAQGAKPCPYCTNLDGQVVGIDQPFVTSGDYQPEGQEPMRVYGAKTHPPLHSGCTCSIVAG